VYDAIIQSMMELKELENWKEKRLFWQIWITLAWPICRPFATHVWVATHTLGTASLKATKLWPGLPF